jgi:hypothetical protein
MRSRVTPAARNKAIGCLLILLHTHRSLSMTSVRCHGARNHVDDAIPFHGGVTAIVIHASRDDNMTDPGGNAGATITCGVITK